MIAATRGPDGEIPVIGVCSASDFGSKEEKRARYHLYRVESEGGKHRISLTQRGYDPNSRAFVDEGGQLL